MLGTSLEDFFKGIREKNKYMVQTAKDMNHEFVEKAIEGQVWDSGNLSIHIRQHLEDAVKKHILDKTVTTQEQRKEMGMEHENHLVIYYKHGKPLDLHYY